MKAPKVSVIMMTYQHEKSIRKAIEGVLMQKANFPVELIIADDASPDDTQKIVNQIIKENDTAHIIKYTKHRLNKGVHQNFFWAYRQTQGKYIALCEGDDYWTDPYKLQKQVDFMETNHDFSVCGTYCDIERYGKLEKVKQTPFLTFNLYDIISNNRIPTLTMMFRNHLIDYQNLPQYPLGDVALLLELTKSGQKLAKLGFNSGVYRYHGQGANSGSSRYQNRKVQFETKFLFAKNIKNQKFYRKLKIYVFKIFIDELKRLLLHPKDFDYNILKLSFKYLFK